MKTGRASKRVSSTLFALFAGLIIALPLVQAPPAQAANPTTGFNAGNIISDSLFYNGSALRASQAQTFLNQRVPSPTSSSLRNYKQNTVSRAADRYCKAYAGRSGETAAQIISKVGQACGISQQALLVILEKETSLVSMRSPEAWRYDRAMGYACPDTGPGGSANCDTSYYGFFNQVWHGARQLKRYGIDTGVFNWFPVGQTVGIQYHPNTACGRKNVRIANKATAALYYYTPYTPNQAALNAGWGTGDSCSSYGNRNFYALYKSWFGNPVGAAYPRIDAKYAQNSWLGAPTTDYNYHAHNGGGAVRAYENGAITWRTGMGSAFILTGDFRTYFGGQGGLAGHLGWPTADQQEWDRGRTQGFQGGAVSWTAEHGFAAVRGAIRTHYADAALAYNGPLGWPTGEQACTTSTQCSQNFEHGRIQLKGSTPSISVPEIDTVAAAEAAQLGAITQTPRAQLAHGGGFVQGHRNGAIAWSEKNGAHVVTGGIRKAFGAAGGVAGPYGWPTAAQVCSSDGLCSQSFLGGTIQVDADGKTVSMARDVKDAYDALQDEGIDLGKSLGDTRIETGGNGGLVHPFEYGAIAASDRTGAYAVMAPIRTSFGAAGGLTGPLGWPTGNARVEEINGGGTVQGFEGGAITSTASGSYVLSGSMRAAFGAHGGLTGSLGWPQSNLVQHTVNGGGAVQAFQGGALVQRTGTTVPVLLEGEIRSVFGQAGGLAGTPGWPTGEARAESANGGGRVQGFQNAAIASSEHGTFMVTGEIRRYYSTQGGLTGSLGWPTSALSVTTTEERQSFQGGVVVRDRATGAVSIETVD